MQILVAWHRLARGRRMQLANGTLGPDMSCSGLRDGLVLTDCCSASITGRIKHEATNKTARHGTTALVEALRAEGTALSQSEGCGAWRAVDGQTRDEDDRYMQRMDCMVLVSLSCFRYPALNNNRVEEHDHVLSYQPGSQVAFAILW